MCIRNTSRKTIRRNTISDCKKIKITLDSKEIPMKTNFKCLGITYTNLFKFNIHGKNTIRKGYNILYKVITYIILTLQK